MTTVVISGANRGIGLEFARQYSADGATVIAGVRKPEEAEALSAIPGVEVHALDVTDDASVRDFHAAVGDRSVDILIANAGVYGKGAQRPGDFDFNDWASVFDTNSLGPARLAQAFRDNLKAGGEKKLVAITSVMGSTEGHDGGHFAYRASKAALNNIWAGLAKAYADDAIICLPLHPGWVQTDMGGKDAQITPEQSVSGLRKVIAAATRETSGRYLAYDGKALAW